MVKLTRAEQNPILTPSDLLWEDMLVFNPGAVVSDGKILLLYRAKGKIDKISRFGLAESTDGIHFTRKEKPVYAGDNHVYEKRGVEDPRLVKIDDTFYFVYTAVIEDTGGKVDPNWNEQIAKKPQIAIAATKDFEFFHEYGVIIKDILGKDASLFPRKINDKYYLLFREGVGQTFLAISQDIDNWSARYPLFNKRPDSWDSQRAGVGAPPIETEKGWLLFYHGVDNNNTYKIGVMFLDLENPGKIIYRLPEPVLEPEMEYEKTGFIPNTVFSCGAVEKDDKYFVYYGAADQVICLATIDKKLILELF